MPTVLIAEDEYLVRIGLRTCIDWEQHGFQLLEDVTDGLTAYNRIVEERPDILLLDIKMPRMTGFQLLEKLKSEKIPVQTVILSCCDDFDSVRSALQLGVLDYINKLTLNPTDLLNTLLKIQLSRQSAPSEQRPAMQPITSANPTATFESILRGQQVNLEIAELFPSGYVLCLYATFEATHTFLSSNICLTMSSQILKSGNIPHLICCNQNGSVCVLLPQTVDKVQISNMLTQNFDRFLNASCFTHFGPLYTKPDEIFETYLLAREIEDDAPFSGEVTQEFLSSIELSSIQSISPRLQYSTTVNEVIHYLFVNSDRLVSLSEVAKHVHISESYLSQLFKRETGENFITYCHRSKINLAKVMLLNHMSIGDICLKIGFDNPSYFSKIFKRMTGVSPQQFKMYPHSQDDKS